MPTDEKEPPDAMHFSSLSLENVRAFGSPQSLELVDDWNLILGENGVGKTTLMHALAVMWPVPAYKSPDDRAPTVSMPQLSEREKNNDIEHFIRRGGPGKATMTAVLRTKAGVELKMGVTITGSAKLEDVEWLDDPVILGGEVPSSLAMAQPAMQVGTIWKRSMSEKPRSRSLGMPSISTTRSLSWKSWTTPPSATKTP